MYDNGRYSSERLYLTVLRFEFVIGRIDRSADLGLDERFAARE